MFSGGREFQFPGGAIVRGSNITPDDETGIGKWSKETFVERFKMYADTAFVSPTVNPGDFNTVMPWLMYCQMTEQDLSAIYEYLPTDNRTGYGTRSSNFRVLTRKYTAISQNN